VLEIQSSVMAKPPSPQVTVPSRSFHELCMYVTP
jgi:hypothetical protein